jgi:hypothetical protein
VETFVGVAVVTMFGVPVAQTESKATSGFEPLYEALQASA